MTGLLRKPLAAEGLVHDLTPETARGPLSPDWAHVGFALHRLAPGAVAQGTTGGREVILVLVEGHARITGAGLDFGRLGTRHSVFERLAPDCIYLPPGSDWRAEACSPCTLAVCSAPGSEPGSGPGEGVFPPRRLEVAPLVQRGQGSNTRFIHNIAMEGQPVAGRLLVTEVFTPGGNWSSYPPHRHDEDDFPRMTWLEETYYHRLDPPDAFGLQRVFTDDLSLDATMAVADHDLVLVPRGHHPCAAPHGVEMYYLNVMAGPRRAWRFETHPAFAHLA